ncbi:hypothetical protein ACFY4C_17145 [Actinomadura viridis]|uniref:hypothetical protein n=1 Tax=Actinomadura viridis TaxID=58110 RepID=UPI0036BFDB34
MRPALVGRGVRVVTRPGLRRVRLVLMLLFGPRRLRRPPLVRRRRRGSGPRIVLRLPLLAALMLLGRRLGAMVRLARGGLPAPVVLLRRRTPPLGTLRVPLPLAVPLLVPLLSLVALLALLRGAPRVLGDRGRAGLLRLPVLVLCRRRPVRASELPSVPVLRLALLVLRRAGHRRLRGPRRLVRALPVPLLLVRGVAVRRVLVGRLVLALLVGCLLVRLLRALPVGLPVLRGGGRRDSRWLLVVVPLARPPAAPGARQVGPAAQAEQIPLLEGLVTDWAVQGRHDTSPARIPARSSVDVR